MVLDLMVFIKPFSTIFRKWIQTYIFCKMVTNLKWLVIKHHEFMIYKCYFV